MCERYIGSVRWECLNHVLIFGERQLYRVIKAYVEYYNHSRPHQGIGQHIPYGPDRPMPNTDQSRGDKIICLPVLNGLHHEYRRAA